MAFLLMSLSNNNHKRKKEDRAFIGCKSDPCDGAGACSSQQSWLSCTSQEASRALALREMPVRLPVTRTAPPEFQQLTKVRNSWQAVCASLPSPRCLQVPLKVHCLALQLPGNLEWPLLVHGSPSSYRCSHGSYLTDWGRGWGGWLKASADGEPRELVGLLAALTHSS